MANKQPLKRVLPDRNTGALVELERLAHAIEEGRLSERARPDLMRQEEQGVAIAVNRIVEALTAPLAVATDCISKLSGGTIPPKIANAYAGDLSAVVNGLNACIDEWSGLLAEMSRMSEEHTRGDIDVFIPLDRFEGAYRAMARGVNE